MAYMVYQRVATAIHDAYGPFGEPSGTGYAARTANLQTQLDMARQARTWLESLSVEPTLLASIVEPIAVIEDAFRALVGASHATVPAPQRHVDDQ
jgi:hypothetical protein